MPFDYYEPKFLRGVIRETLPLRTWFKSFFPNVVTFPTETVSFEYKEAGRKLAPYVNPRIGSEAMERDGYAVRDYRTPLIGINRAITADTLAQKLLGEAEWNSGVTPDERARRIASEDVAELQDYITRREEYMCARVKQDGKLTIKGNGVNDSVDYGFKNIVTTSSGDKWTASYDIIGQLTALARTLQKDGVNPDMLILGEKAAQAIIANAAIRELLDNKSYEMGRIEPSQLPNGVNYIGQLVGVGLNLKLYTYLEWYPDDDGKLKPIVDDETVIMQSSTEKNSILYGMVTIMDSSGNFQTHMEPYVPETWFDQPKAQRFISIKSRPLPMPHDVKSWLVIKDVVSGTSH